MRVRAETTESLVLKRYDTILIRYQQERVNRYFHGIILEPPEPIAEDKFESNMFGILDLMIRIHEETYGKKPSKIKLGRFELNRLSRFITRDEDRTVYEYYLPETFPFQALTNNLEKDEALMADPAVREKKVPIFIFKGMEVIKVRAFFHFEPVN